MDNPIVSVLIPVYHVEQYIERCARSVFNQSYQNLEYIFVDDASDDASIDILKRIIPDYPDRSENIHIIRHNKNKGLASARNTAVANSRGDFVFHVDADDWVETNAIELLVKKQQETNADIVSGEALDDNNGVKTKHQTSGWDLDKEALLSRLLTYKASPTLWRRLIRRKLYSDNHIKANEQGSGGEDFQVLPRLVYFANKVSGIDDVIYFYNISNQQSITNNVSIKLESQIQGHISVKEIVSFFSDKEPHLRDLVAGMDVRNIHFRMMYNINNRNKKGFDVFLKYMKESNPKYWKLVSWDNFWVKSFESNYYTFIIFRKFKGFYYRIKKLLKRFL